MLDKLINSEIQYINQFSQSHHNKDIIRFWDSNLPDMYIHNFTLLKNNMNIYQTILNELEKRKKDGKNFLRIEANFNIDNSIINKLPITPEVSIYDYMCIETDNYKLLNGNPNCIIKEAITNGILKDGMEVDILANKGVMGLDFAKKRIERKVDIYKSIISNTNLYVCYHNDFAIGNCELMINKRTAKIEDFDIIAAYQRKGFGTSILRHLLKQANDSNAKIAYLITDSSDTAKEMYEKNKFYKVGEKIELFFNL